MCAEEIVPEYDTWCQVLENSFPTKKKYPLLVSGIVVGCPGGQSPGAVNYITQIHSEWLAEVTRNTDRHILEITPTSCCQKQRWSQEKLPCVKCGQENCPPQPPASSAVPGLS